MAELFAWDGEKLVPVPGNTVTGDEPCVMVWDADTKDQRAIPVTEAAHGMLRYAKSLRLGELARAEVELQALAMLEAAGQWPPWKRKRRSR